MSTNVKTKATMTAEQRQTLYGHLLENLEDDVFVSYASRRNEIAQTEHLGYAYATQWKLEPLLVAEFLLRDMSPVAENLKRLVAGGMSEAEFLEGTRAHRQELAGELLRQRPWEHRSTSGLTSLMGTFQATAKSQAVEMIDRIVWRLEK